MLVNSFPFVRVRSAYRIPHLLSYWEFHFIVRAIPYLKRKHDDARRNQGCGVGIGVGRNFRWIRSRKEFLGGVGVGKNVPSATPTSV
jgi:hypothetical protein